MKNSQITTERALREEVGRLQARLDELEATQRAIRGGDVDAIVVEGPRGTQVFTLQSPEDPYRVLAERMNEGAATLTADGIILFCNRRLAEMVELPSEQLVGSSFSTLLSEHQQRCLTGWLQCALEGDIRAEGELLRGNGTLLPVQLSMSLASLSETEQVICAIATDISELKRAKQGLRDQAEVFELARDAIVMRGLDSRIQTWNRGARDVYGWSAEEAIGRVSFELLETVFPEPLETIMASLHARKEWEGELKQIRSDGKAIIVAGRWSLLRDEQGNPSAILEINRDITQRKQTELALYKSERDYRNIAELVPQLIWKCTPDGLSVYFNQKWADYTGLTLEESYGRGWDTPFHPNDKQRAWIAWNHAVSTGETYRIDSRLRAADGSYRWFLIKGVPLRDQSSNIVEWFGTCTDIQDLKEAEARLNSASRYARSLIEASLDPLVTISHAGKITDVNAATEAVTGISRQCLIGTDFSDYFTEPDKARQGYQQVFAEGAVHDYPLAIRGASGVVTDVLYNASVFRSDAGEVEGVFAAARDVTERNRIEAARDQANDSLRRLNQELEARVALRTAEISRVNEQLTDSNKDLESFAYSVSHDLRAPLRHIDGFLALLSERSYSTLDDKAKHYVDRILEASQRMGRLIDELLQFSRIGRAEIRKVKVDVNALVEQIWSELEPETRNRKIALRVDQFPDLEADPVMLRELLQNLIANALKFTRNCETAEIDIECEHGSKDDIVFHVRDNGAGFDMRYYNKLFQVFQRLHTDNEFEGTGIGLALARRVVERHGGRIWAEGAVGAGATFFFSLPAPYRKGEAHELAQAHLVG